MDCVHTRVQALMHRTSELMVHKEACTRMCTMEMAKELRGVEQSKQCIARTCVCNPRASSKCASNECTADAHSGLHEDVHQGNCTGITGGRGEEEQSVQCIVCTRVCNPHASHE